MDHKELGDTGVQIPEIGLGTAGYVGGDGPLRRSIELGASLIDTSESYMTETAVASAVRGIRDQVFIATKVSHTHYGFADVLRAAEGSLLRLGTDYIDLYQVHFPLPEFPIEDTMRAMDRLVREGMVRYIGVSNFSVEQLEVAQAASENKIVSNQVRYSVVDRRIESELLPYCQANDVTVLAYSPLEASGGLSKVRAGLREGALAEVARATGKTEAQVALNYCISQERLVAIPRSNSIAHTEENCLASGWRLTSDELGMLKLVA